MMIEPPVDKLIAKVGCKYALVCLVTKRTRHLLDKNADLIGTSVTRAISYASQEIYQDHISMINE